MKLVHIVICALVSMSLVACKEDSTPDDQVFTLYQNAPSDNHARVGIATFDMKWGKTMNYHYCQKFADFLQKEWEADPEVKRRKSEDLGVAGQRHWCEKGRYKQ